MQYSETGRAANLAVRREDVHDAEERHQRHTDDPHQQLLPERQRLQEAHLRPEPDAGQMLLAVRMRHKLVERHTERIKFAQIRMFLTNVKPIFCCSVRSDVIGRG